MGSTACRTIGRFILQGSDQIGLQVVMSHILGNSGTWAGSVSSWGSVMGVAVGVVSVGSAEISCSASAAPIQGEGEKI